jgi:hypothetical protein
MAFGLCLFASSETMIYYSSELKHYSSDVTFALIAYLLLMYISSRQSDFLSLVGAGIGGAGLIWFSFPVVFILFGGGMALAVSYGGSKNWYSLMRLAVIGSVWILSFLIYYGIYLKTFIIDQKLIDFWAGTYTPVYPLDQYGIKWYTVKWFFYNFVKIFKNPVGLFFPLLGALLAIVGVWHLGRTKKQLWGMLFWPMIVTLLASAFHKYPFHGRLLNFLVPAFIIFVAAGIERIDNRIKNQKTFLTAGLILLLLVHPVGYALYGIFNPVLREEIKPVLEYIQHNRQEGDILYLYFAAQYAFRWYAGRYGFSPKEYLTGTDLARDPASYPGEFNKLGAYKKVWITFSHVYENDEASILSYLDTRGRRIDAFRSIGASAYLYDLKGKNRK